MNSKGGLKAMMNQLKPLKRICLYTNFYIDDLIDILRSRENSSADLTPLFRLAMLAVSVKDNVIITRNLDPNIIEGPTSDKFGSNLKYDNNYTDASQRFNDWESLNTLVDMYTNRILKLMFIDLAENEQNIILSKIDKLKEKHCISYTKGSNIGLAKIKGGKRTRRKHGRSRKNTKRQRH
jgi:hypothetical protein